MNRLFIDLEKCYKCKECTAKCSYSKKNKGIVRCLALAAQELVCRRCEEAPCVKACPQKALEKDSSGMLHRYSMRCTSCKTCTISCPFGVIYPDIVEYKTSMCDYCEGRANENVPPICVQTCPHNALEWKDMEENKEADIFEVRKGKFLVHTAKWKK